MEEDVAVEEAAGVAAVVMAVEDTVEDTAAGAAATATLDGEVGEAVTGGKVSCACRCPFPISLVHSVYLHIEVLSIANTHTLVSIIIQPCWSRVVSA